jgi:hypothetical protein
MGKINGAVHRTTPFWRRKEVAEHFQTGLPPAGFLILTAESHHGTHCGKFTAWFGTDLSNFPVELKKIAGNSIDLKSFAPITEVMRFRPIFLYFSLVALNLFWSSFSKS